MNRFDSIALTIGRVVLFAVIAIAIYGMSFLGLTATKAVMTAGATDVPSPTKVVINLDSMFKSIPAYTIPMDREITLDEVAIVSGDTIELGVVTITAADKPVALSTKLDTLARAVKSDTIAFTADDERNLLVALSVVDMGARKALDSARAAETLTSLDKLVADANAEAKETIDSAMAVAAAATAEMDSGKTVEVGATNAAVQGTAMLDLDVTKVDAPVTNMFQNQTQDAGF